MSTFDPNDPRQIRVFTFPDRPDVVYANEWRAKYRCAGCSDVACPQCGAEGVPTATNPKP